MIRKAKERDASSLAAVGIEVWVNTYLRHGVSPVFADYVLAEFTAQKFRNAIGNPDLAIWVSENRTGIDGFVKVCSTAAPLQADCSPLEISDPVCSTEAPVGRKGRRAVASCPGSLQEPRRRKRLAEGRSRKPPGHRLLSPAWLYQIGSTDFVIADKAYENYVHERQTFGSRLTDPRRHGEGNRMISRCRLNSISLGSQCAPGAR